MPRSILAALIATLVATAPASAQTVGSIPTGWGDGGTSSDQRDRRGDDPWGGWRDGDGNGNGGGDTGWDEGEGSGDGSPGSGEGSGSGDGSGSAPDDAPAPGDGSPGSGWIDGDELSPPGLGEQPGAELLPPAGARPVVKGRFAKLGANGAAYAPSKAPAAVKRVIWAANQLKAKPYKWGGGHGRWKDSGYDCSGAVSYALHAAGLLGAPQTSGMLARYGKSGLGKWISIYANNGHVFMVVAGMRFDTSPYGSGARGPRWRVTGRPAGGFKVRHPAGL